MQKQQQQLWTSAGLVPGQAYPTDHIQEGLRTAPQLLQYIHQSQCLLRTQWGNRMYVYVAGRKVGMRRAKS